MTTPAARGECLACTMRYILLPGKICGFIPVGSVCPHTNRNVPCSIFMKSKQKNLGLTWLLVLMADCAGLIFLGFQASGFSKMEVLSEALTYLTCANALFCAFRKCPIFILELNGLSRIIRDSSQYGFPELITVSTSKLIRRVSGILTICCFLCFLFFTIMKLEDFARHANLIEIREVLTTIGMVTGGFSFGTLVNQLWIKILLMSRICRTANLQLKEILSQRVAEPFRVTEGSVAKMSRLYAAILRNQKESSRYLNPGMTFSLCLVCANFILAFYLIIGSEINKSFQFTLQLKTYLLILVMVLILLMQQLLDNAVSTFLSNNLLLVIFEVNVAI